MIPIDTNILVYAHRVETAWHDRAERVVRELADSAGPWAIPWPCVHEFLAITTHPRTFRTPTPIGTAIDQLDAWRESPSVVPLAEDEDYWR